MIKIKLTVLAVDKLSTEMTIEPFVPITEVEKLIVEGLEKVIENYLTNICLISKQTLETHDDPNSKER